jgi:tetratricopeptide (TPR) repeat protein
VLDDIRAHIDHTLAAGTASAGKLDALDEAVADHQHALTVGDPLSVLATVALDLLEVHTLAEQRQPPATQARLSAAATHMCLIVADALTRLDAPHAARAWYRTARLAADDAALPALQALALTQTAAALHATGDPEQALRLTRKAQQLDRAPDRAASPMRATAPNLPTTARWIRTQKAIDRTVATAPTTMRTVVARCPHGPGSSCG